MRQLIDNEIKIEQRLKTIIDISSEYKRDKAISFEFLPYLVMPIDDGGAIIIDLVEIRYNSKEENPVDCMDRLMAKHVDYALNETVNYGRLDDIYGDKQLKDEIKNIIVKELINNSL